MELLIPRFSNEKLIV